MFGQRRGLIYGLAAARPFPLADGCCGTGSHRVIKARSFPRGFCPLGLEGLITCSQGRAGGVPQGACAALHMQSICTPFTICALIFTALMTATPLLNFC